MLLIGADILDAMTIFKRYAAALGGLSQAVGKLMNIAGGVAFGIEAAVVVARQCRFDGAHLVRGDCSALQAAFAEQLGDLCGVVITRFVAVDMQNAFLLEVKADLLVFRPLKQVLSGRNGQSRGLGGVGSVAGYRGDKFAKPTELVPAWAGVNQ